MPLFRARIIRLENNSFRDIQNGVRFVSEKTFFETERKHLLTAKVKTA
jgi:hypothetical protein